VAALVRPRCAILKTQSTSYVTSLMSLIGSRPLRAATLRRTAPRIGLPCRWRGLRK
jgi:hypothetical protein